MGFIERKIISKYKLTSSRYIDNCFVLGKHLKNTDELFCVLNETHLSTKFTSEKKNNNVLSLLDVLVK